MAADSAVRIIFLGDSASAVRSVSRLESSFGGLGRTARLVTGAVGIAFIGALAGATKAAIDFDRSMRNVNSIAKLSEAQFQSLSKRVLALGASTGQTPKVLADGLYDIVSSGFAANDAIKILAVSAKAATAGMTDTATASKAVVAILNAYGLQAGKARNVSSLLFKEVQLGVNTFEELATNIGDTAPLAAALKIPFSDVSAGLALITLHGTSMAEAATQMSRVMADLLKPSKGLTKELHSLGYENGQAAIQAHGFIPLIAQLSKEAHGSAATTADWFQNIRSLRGMLNLTGPNLAKFNEFAAQMSGAFRRGGADVAAFNEQAKSISVQWAMAKSALIAAAIPIGQLLFPALIKASQGIAYLANVVEQHMPQIKRLTSEAVRAIADGWQRFAVPAIRVAQQAVVAIAQQVRAHWPQIRSTAQSLGSSLRSIFASVRSIIESLLPVVRALAPAFRAALAVIVVAVRVWAALMAFEFRLVAAAIRVIAPALAGMINAFTAGFSGALSVVKSVGGAIVGIIHGIESAIHSLVAALHALQSAVSAVKPNFGTAGLPPGQGGRLPPGHAAGGFVEGQRGSPQLILAHAGEVILNPMQQAAFGGAAFFKQMFGFTGAEGPGFAAGGIVSKPKRKKSGRSPHHPKRGRVRTTNKRARALMAAVDAVNQQEDDTDRAYGQLVRFDDISQEQFIRTDAAGNQYVSQPDIDQRVAEIDGLIAARDRMLELLEKEKKELKKAIAALRKAIATMLQAIQQERKTTQALAKRLSAEKKKKKPNQGLVTSLENQISASGTRIGDLTNTIGDFRNAIKDEQLNLVHTLPFDRRDVELDVLTLRQERSDVLGTSLGPGGAGGVGGAGGGGGTDDFLLQLIGQLRLALGIQTAQQAIIGSFAKGTLSVPETGLALVHAGEQIIPAGRSRDTASPALPDIHLHVIVEDGAVNEDKIRAVAVSAHDQISLRQGTSASERLRSGRY